MMLMVIKMCWVFYRKIENKLHEYLHVFPDDQNRLLRTLTSWPRSSVFTSLLACTCQLFIVSGQIFVEKNNPKTVWENQRWTSHMVNSVNTFQNWAEILWFKKMIFSWKWKLLEITQNIEWNNCLTGQIYNVCSFKAVFSSCFII